jgi:hypothetical protein
MRPGDFIVVNPTEVDLLTSNRFKQVASAELMRKISLTPAERGGIEYYRLALPKIGRPIVEALNAFAEGDADAEEEVTAHGLALAISQRIAPR